MELCVDTDAQRKTGNLGYQNGALLSSGASTCHISFWFFLSVQEMNTQESESSDGEKGRHFPSRTLQCFLHCAQTGQRDLATLWSALLCGI